MRSAIQCENRVSTFLSRGFNIRNMGLDMGQVFKTLKIRMSYHFVASWHWLSCSCRGTSYPHLKYQVWSNSFDVFRGEFQCGSPNWTPEIGKLCRMEPSRNGCQKHLSHTAICVEYISDGTADVLWIFQFKRHVPRDLFIKTTVFGWLFYLHRSQKTHDFLHCRQDPRSSSP